MKKIVGIALIFFLIGIFPFVNAEITLSTNQMEYTKGETIIFHVEGAPFQSTVINGKMDNRIQFSLNVVLDDAGKADVNYTIPFTNVSGEWELSLSGESKSNYVMISPSNASSIFIITFNSPTPSKYARLETIPISVNVTNAGIGVNNAVVHAWTPEGKEIILQNIMDGRYEGSFHAPPSQLLENWLFFVTAEAETENGLRGGENSIALEFKPAILQLDVLTPLPSVIGFQETISITFQFSYPEGKTIDVVSDITFGEEKLTATPIGNGKYTVEFSPKKDGLNILKVSAFDEFGNSVLRDFPFQVRSQLETIWEQNKMLIFVVGSALILLLIFVGYRREKSIAKNKNNEQIQKLQKELQILQKAYYKEQTVDRKTFESESSRIQNEKKALETRIQKE
ncbi:MAG: hypothetical protein V1776_03380 [Candidatus Diapherotrites archaeon]